MAMKLNYDLSDGSYFLTGTIEELTNVYDMLSTEEARREFRVRPYGSDSHFIVDGGKHAITFEPNGWTSLEDICFSNIWCIDEADGQYFEVIKDYGDDLFCINDVIDDIKNMHYEDVRDILGDEWDV